MRSSVVRQYSEAQVVGDQMLMQEQSVLMEEIKEKIRRSRQK